MKVGKTRITLVRGDITSETTDVIVNAANSSLMGGGGVDGAIHRSGGPQILEECKAIRAQKGDLPTGGAVITTGGRLKARHVIHTVGPVWRGGLHREDEQLADAYKNCLSLLASNGLRTVAFPSISTGVYGFPIKRASRIAFDVVAAFVKKNSGIEEVRFVTFSQEDYDEYARLFDESQMA